MKHKLKFWLIAPIALFFALVALWTWWYLSVAGDFIYTWHQ